MLRYQFIFPSMPAGSEDGYDAVGFICNAYFDERHFVVIHYLVSLGVEVASEPTGFGKSDV